MLITVFTISTGAATASGTDAGVSVPGIDSPSNTLEELNINMTVINANFPAKMNMRYEGGKMLVPDIGADSATLYGNNGVNYKLELNTGDDYDRGVYYLTCTGLSQEMGDDGSVGRGNRCNGLITPYRPMSMEATSGKNPITHIGKIYNVMSKLIADDIAAKVSPEVEVKVRILSQIGKPVSQPLNCSVQLVSEEVNEGKLNQWRAEAESIAYDWLDNVDKVTELIIDGKVRTF